MAEKLKHHHGALVAFLLQEEGRKKKKIPSVRESREPRAPCDRSLQTLPLNHVVMFIFLHLLPKKFGPKLHGPLAAEGKTWAL